MELPQAHRPVAPLTLSLPCKSMYPQISQRVPSRCPSVPGLHHQKLLKENHETVVQTACSLAPSLLLVGFPSPLSVALCSSCSSLSSHLFPLPFSPAQLCSLPLICSAPFSVFSSLSLSLFSSASLYLLLSFPVCNFLSLSLLISLSKSHFPFFFSPVLFPPYCFPLFLAVLSSAYCLLALSLLFTDLLPSLVLAVSIGCCPSLPLSFQICLTASLSLLISLPHGHRLSLCLFSSASFSLIHSLSVFAYACSFPLPLFSFLLAVLPLLFFPSA